MYAAFYPHLSLVTHIDGGFAKSLNGILKKILTRWYGNESPTDHTLTYLDGTLFRLKD